MDVPLGCRHTEVETDRDGPVREPERQVGSRRCPTEVAKGTLPEQVDGLLRPQVVQIGERRLVPISELDGGERGVGEASFGPIEPLVVPTRHRHQVTSGLETAPPTARGASPTVGVDPFGDRHHGIDALAVLRPRRPVGVTHPANHRLASATRRRDPPSSRTTAEPAGFGGSGTAA